MRRLLLVALGAVVLALPAAPADAKRKCHKSYRGACLRPHAADYDCADGGGDGPRYVYRVVRVVGPDVYGLDADQDGYGCEDD